MSARVAIAGGGPAGLMMGRLLAADGHEVKVLEAGPEIGGLCRSRVVDGYTFDLAGGHIMFTRDQRVSDFWTELFADDPAVETERRTRILHQRDHWVSYPFENALGELPLEHNLECTEESLRAYLRRRAGEPEPSDFHAWIRWKMGDGIAKHFMDPYNRKIWKSDLREMGTSWIAGRVPDAPLEDVLTASLGRTTEGYTHQSHFRYPRVGGFAAIHERIARPIVDRIEVNHPVERIERAPDGGWTVLYARARRVIESSRITTSFLCSTKRLAFSITMSATCTWRVAGSSNVDDTTSPLTERCMSVTSSGRSSISSTISTTSGWL